MTAVEVVMASLPAGLLAGFVLRGWVEARLRATEDQRIRREPHWRTFEMFGREERQE